MTDIRVGPVGGDGGNPFDNYSVPFGAQVSEVHLLVGDFIDAIQLVCIQADGERVVLDKLGGLGGSHKVFTLDTDEYIVGLSGNAERYVNNIRIHTNKRSSELFGGRGQAENFTLMAPEGMAVNGLFGREDWFIDQLGIIAGAAVTVSQTSTLVDVDGDEVPDLLVTQTTQTVSDSLSESTVTTTETSILLDSDNDGTPDNAVVADIVVEVDSQSTTFIDIDGDDVPDMLVTEVVQHASDSAGEVTMTSTQVSELVDVDGDGVPDIAVPVDNLETLDIVDYTEDEASDGDTAAIEAFTPIAGSCTDPKPRDLMRVEGIGPKIAGLLVDKGVCDLEHLSKVSVEFLQEMLQEAGRRYRLADPSTWPEQAAIGATGDFEALKEFQNKLHGGRRLR